MPSNVSLTIYNLLGQNVKTLVDGSQYAGESSVVWDGTNDAGTRVASGVYFYRLKAGKFLETKKFLLMR